MLAAFEVTSGSEYEISERQIVRFLHLRQENQAGRAGG
jgi:hypothetical protein